MKVYQGLEGFSKLDFGVVTSGTFDGVHVGHQKILDRLKEIAAQSHGQTVVITFWPHPRIVLSKEDSSLFLLSTIEEKIKLLENQGIDHLVVLPFTEDFSQLSPDQFVKKIYIEAIGTKKLVIGYDHRFGKDREGGFDYLKQNLTRFDFEVEEIPRQDIDHVGISSTKIRNALIEGNIRIANQYLGYAYAFSGEVVHGDKIGRTIGFPTANIEIKEHYKLIPSDGIYAVNAMLNEREIKGMLYIGKRPTVDGLTKKIEVHLFDFEGDIYGQNLEIMLIDKIRDDEKLGSLEQLKERLQQDMIAAKQILIK